VSFVPLPEGSSVDLDDGGFGKGVGADKFVVRRVVGDDDDADFACDSFRAPGEVAGIKTEAAVFRVSTSSADKMDSLRPDTGVGWLATFLESSVESSTKGLTSQIACILKYLFLR